MKQTTQQLVYINQYMQEAANNLKQIGSIKDLQINNINQFLDELLCLKQTNRYYQSIDFSTLINSIKLAIGNCDNQALFNVSWGGVTKNLKEEIGNAQTNSYGILKNLSADQLATKSVDVDASMEQAYQFQQVGSNYNEATNLELANKYKKFSDNLMNLSQQLSQALNQIDAGLIEATKAERLELMAKSMDYQLKAMEYEEKYAQLLEKASALSHNDNHFLSTYKKDIGIKQIVLFRQ